MRSLMGPKRKATLLALTSAAFVARMTCVWAQSGVAPTQDRPAAPSDQTLEIAPRIAPPPRPAVEPAAPATGASGDAAAQSSDGAGGVAQPTPAANTNHPYLGIA